MSISVNNMEGMAFDFNELRNDASDSYLNFVTVTKEALDKAFLSTDIKRQFQGAEVMKVKSELVTNAKISSLDPKISVEFLVQVTLASITLYKVHISSGSSFLSTQSNFTFFVFSQLTVNMTEDRIKNHLIRTLKSSNFSVGRTGVISSRNMSDYAARGNNSLANSNSVINLQAELYLQFYISSRF
jgi:hypothetical protein